MAKILSISIADNVNDQINKIILEKGIKNKSEFCEELIRDGLRLREEQQKAQEGA